MLDFTKMEKPEGMTDEMLGDSKVQSYVQGLIDNQKAAAVSQVQTLLDGAIQAKAIADQKVEDLRAQSKKVKPVDNTEHTAAIQALNDQIAENKAMIAQQNAKLDIADVSKQMAAEIAAYNSANKGSKIASGAESYVMDAMLATFRKNEAGQIVPFKGDSVLTGNSGFMTGVEFISNFKNEKPLFFEQPSGGGAAGGGNGGAGSKEMTRDAFNALHPMEQAKAALSHTIIE